MITYTLPYFGEIDLDELDNYYDVDIEFEGEPIQLDINSESGSADKELMDTVKMFIENLSAYKVKANEAIIADFKNDETVKDYIDHHLEVIDEDESDIILKDTDKKLSKEEQLLSLLHLVRVGFYLDDQEEFAVFDFTIGREITDYLVVVKFNRQGGVEYIEMES